MARPDNNNTFAQILAGGVVGAPKPDNNDIQDHIYSRFKDARENRNLTFSESPLGDPGKRLAGTIYHGSRGVLMLAHGDYYGIGGESRDFAEKVFEEIKQTGIVQAYNNHAVEELNKIVARSHDMSLYDRDINGHDILPNLQTIGKYVVAAYEASAKGSKKLYNKRREAEDRALLKKDAIVLLCMLELGTMLLFAAPEVYQRYVHELEDMEYEGRQVEWLQEQEEHFKKIGILPQ